MLRTVMNLLNHVLRSPASASSEGEVLNDLNGKDTNQLIII